MQKTDVIPYNTKDNTRSSIVNDEAYYFISHLPEYFPFVTENAWMKNKEYFHNRRPMPHGRKQKNNS